MREIRSPWFLPAATLLAVAACSSGTGAPSGVPDAAMDAAVESRPDVPSPGDAAVEDAPTIADAAGAPSDRSVSADGAREASPADGRDLSADDSPDTARGDTGGGCGAGMILCGTTCIDPTIDPKHCGATPGCGANGSSVGAVCGDSQACSTLVFRSQSFATGASPRAVAVADLNADGRVDLAIANAQANSVSILSGNGDGTFQSEQSFAVHSAPQAIAVGDLNGDSKLDLVVANHQSDDVSLLLGNGDGTFRPHLDLPIAEQPYALVLGDVNGDGKLDLAVACGASESVSVLLGAGDGTFRPELQLTTAEVGSNGIAGVGAADLDGDGKLDLVINNEKGVNVYLGKGDGTFQPRIESYFYSGSALAFGDLDGDGKQDVLAESLMGAIALLARNHWLVKDRAQDVSMTGSTANSLAIADLNGDGKLDVAATDSYVVNVRMGNGDGTFKPVQHFPGGKQPASIVAHDFDGDGRPELVLVESGANVVRLLTSDTAPLACR